LLLVHGSQVDIEQTLLPFLGRFFLNQAFLGGGRPFTACVLRHSVVTIDLSHSFAHQGLRCDRLRIDPFDAFADRAGPCCGPPGRYLGQGSVAPAQLPLSLLLYQHLAFLFVANRLASDFVEFGWLEPARVELPV